MQKLLFIIFILLFSLTEGFSLKDKITGGKVGDYVVTEQGGTASVLLIRSLTGAHLILEEIAVPTLLYSASDGSWKAWVAKGAPGHTVWVTYLIDLKTNQLRACYSYSEGAWLSTQDPYHFLPRLLSLPLQQTPQQKRKRVGPPPSDGEEDRRSIWSPPVVIEGQKGDKSAITAWNTKWPEDTSLISECEIEVYFSSPTFPIWIEVRHPHYKASLRAIDAGERMISPKPIITGK